MSDEGRALLTEREKEVLAGEADVTDNYRYKVQSIVRNRIRKNLADDIEFLSENFEEGFERALAEVKRGAVEQGQELDKKCAKCRTRVHQYGSPDADYLCTECGTLWTEDQLREFGGA